MGKPVSFGSVDLESSSSLESLEVSPEISSKRIEGIKTVLVVLSSQAMVFDVEALRQKVLIAYPDAAVFFANTDGSPLGVVSPSKIDLIIDFTGPGQRQGMFFALKFRRRARVCVGRNAGFFRTRVYDRILDERSKQYASLPRDLYERERIIQKLVLGLAGVPFIPAGDCTADKSRSIALELPPLAR